jgi:hypothetical protein
MTFRQREDVIQETLSTGQILRKKESMLRYLPKEGGTDEETIRRGMAYS